MNPVRLLKPELIKLDLSLSLEPRDEEEAQRESFRWRCKEEVIAQLVGLFDLTGEVRNATRLGKDIIYREKQVSTGISRGLALPHIRSLQARSLVAVFARSVEGVEFMSLDGKPAHIFLGLAAPPYADDSFLECFGWVASAFKDEFWLYDALMHAESADEVLSILHGLA